MSDAVALIARLREHLRTRAPIPAPVLAAVTDELERRINRDDHLRRAWCVTAVADVPTQRAQQLAAAIERFEASSWPRARDLDAPPAAWSEQSRSLWHAFRLGDGDVPHGWRQLLRVCRGDDKENLRSA